MMNVEEFERKARELINEALDGSAAAVSSLPRATLLELDKLITYSVGRPPTGTATDVLRAAAAFSAASGQKEPVAFLRGAYAALRILRKQHPELVDWL